MSSLPRRASIATFHPPAIMIWIGPVYSEPVHFSSALLRISGMFMAGIAGIVNVRRTWASVTGLPEASVSETWIVFSFAPCGGSGSIRNVNLYALFVEVARRRGFRK